MLLTFITIQESNRVHDYSYIKPKIRNIQILLNLEINIENLSRK